ncbi:MAG: hypothetical protein COU42_02640 [Candidatus Nealsonbacteria bacterium CG10_big_fil_rev_8_21_14_0_10_36_24]|uniref:Uncharacterized protein n=2 Tax=Candidatus Nealsoniibacteriota TaxID=1817911 RepID=A0A2H0YRG3_9BACT|nr:MAG: hypothetical protein COU42_02640 [Candidatus Nealsonbacteria bacterium CG10_big_fil_rev_8_21_14_0_10_36_24]PIS40323.1 MAG: hypothetical protein COT32_00390 [Candidatus Nealsonbacteria bacterium CG08_land_8_20_14_0_20_36_22]
MQIFQILFYILTGFIGYTIGRIGHIQWGHIKSPHHWIYGLFLMFLGLIFYKNFLGLLMFYFGASFFISDFNDFLHLKFYGADEETKNKFWGID